MPKGIVFTDNRAQAFNLQPDVNLPLGAREVEFRARAHKPISAPLGQTWDSFFNAGPSVSDDFVPERTPDHQDKRESL